MNTYNYPQKTLRVAFLILVVLEEIRIVEAFPFILREYFRVYNRWGQLVFSTTVNGHGWNGEISGRPQTTNTFVWLVKAIDYTGKPIFQKGTSTLIR